MVDHDQRELAMDELVLESEHVFGHDLVEAVSAVAPRPQRASSASAG